MFSLLRNDPYAVQCCCIDLDLDVSDIVAFAHRLYDVDFSIYTECENLARAS